MTLDFIFKTITGKTPEQWAETGDLDWFDKYADPRSEAGKGILVANWNNFPHGERQWVKGEGYPDTIVTPTGTKTNGTDSRSARRFQALLERLGYRLEWSDQTSRCDHCYGAIQTEATHYGDTAHYAILGDTEIVCEHCIRKDFAEEYLEGLENNPRAAVAIAGIDPAEHGYELVKDGFESGFHPGQTDSPEKIYRTLREQQYKRLLFVIDRTGQFDVRFSVWAKTEDEEAED